MAALLTSSAAGAVQGAPDRPLTAEDRAAVVEAIARQLEARYVIPEAVPRLVGDLREKLGAGEYAGAATASPPERFRPTSKDESPGFGSAVAGSFRIWTSRRCSSG